MMQYAEENGLRKPDGVLVGDGQAHEDQFFGIPVRAVSEAELSSQDGILVTLREEAQPEIRTYLIACGIREEQVLCQKLFFRQADFDVSCYLPARKSGPYFETEAALDAIGREEGTDKSSEFHDYLKKYEFFLKRFQGRPMTLIELGIFHGQSLRMWGRYFPNARVIGVDIDPACEKLGGDENMMAFIMDLSQMKNLERLKAYHPTIIVDDASHVWSHQIKAFLTLWDALPHGGVYILEDLETSFPSCRQMGFDDAVISTYDFLSAIAEIATSREHLRMEGQPPIIAALKENIERIGGEMDLMSFLHGSCVMVKA